MILQWMAYAALCAALIGLAALSVDGVAGSWRRARRGVWMSAMAASTLVPLVVPALSRARAATPSAQSTNATSTAGATSVATQSQASNNLSNNISNNVDVVVLSVWAAASFLFALLLVVAHRRTTLALRRCLAGTIGGRAAFISDDFGPAVVGLLRHHLVVPTWALTLDDDQQQLVVAHELEHARAGDPLLALAGAIVVVLMPWNVALWWQLGRLRLAIELDCDARVVVRRRNDAVAYGQLLISVGERGRGVRHPVLAMSRSRSALAKRFDALLGRRTIQPRRVASLVVLGAGTLASVAFVPAPNVQTILNEIRPRRDATAQPQIPPLAGSVERASRAIATSAPQASAAKTQVPARTRSVKRTTLPSSIGVKALPPVNFVPSASARGLLDSVVVARATLPPTIRRAGGVLRAIPDGSDGRGGFRAAPSSAVTASDSNRVIRPVIGGRATLVPRPDTSRAPI
jgi:beta-lactamase regulating signal transducer with metallopeptidase domain